jgi:vacuolar-type H+-ATPase subunit D/Vma8
MMQLNFKLTLLQPEVAAVELVTMETEVAAETVDLVFLKEMVLQEHLNHFQSVVEEMVEMEVTKETLEMLVELQM